MASTGTLKCRGLHTANNQLSATPDGALAEAQNVVNRYAGILESRRGQKYLAYGFGGASDRSAEGVFYRDRLLIQYGTALAYDGGSSFGVYSGTYSPPDADNLRMKFCEAGSNLYFTTSAGVKVLTQDLVTPVAAGISAPLKVTGSLQNANGWMTTDTSVAWRAVIGLRDENGLLKLSRPSGRLVLRNSIHLAIGGLVRTLGTTVTVTMGADEEHGLIVGDTVTLTPGEANFVAGVYTVATVTNAYTFTYTDAGANVASTAAQDFTRTASAALRVYLPAGLTTSHFVYLYRSDMSADSADEPQDELWLAHESKIAAADLVAGYVAITDKQPEDFLGDPLYTNPNSGDGPLAANEPPPMAKDICLFQGRNFYWNVTEKARRTIQLIGVGSPDGLQAGDIVFVIGPSGNNFYTAAVSPASATQFKLYTSGTAAQNIERTAKALIDVINADAAQDSYAYYVSGEDEPPGKILIEERGLGGLAVSFVVACNSRPTAWNGMQLPDSTGTFPGEVTARPNGFLFSKRDEPEHVPLLNKGTVGPRDASVLRGIAFRDKQFVFLKKGGVWTVSGEQPPFRVDMLDDTVSCIAADTVVTHANQVYALTDQGFVQVSDAGVKIISGPIDDILVDVMANAPTALAKYGFAVSYEAERMVILYLPSDDADETCTQAYVYNSAYDTWTGPWTGDRTWGRVNKDDGLLYLGEGAANKIRVERKAIDRTDYSDEDLAVNIVSSTGTSVVLTSVGGVTAGDMLYQAEDKKAVIVTVTPATQTLVVDSTVAWSAGAATVKIAIDCEVKWAPTVGGAPSLLKHFRQLMLHFRRFAANVFATIFDSEIQSEESTVTVTVEGFGTPAFGAGQFGIGAANPTNFRCEVPRNHQRASQLRVGFQIREARSVWAVNGYSLEYEVVSERTGRTG